MTQLIKNPVFGLNLPGLLRPVRVLLLLLILPAGLFAQDADLFPRPAALEPAINFWVRVYTEVDTRSGFLHDSQHLSVIYQSLPLNRGEIESTRNRIEEDLRVLGSGKRDMLTSSQQDILALWEEDVSNQTLRTAASNVRWQLGQSDRFLGGLQRSGAYRQHINKVIREKGLPIELGVLPHVESSFNPGAFSSASAAGMWQFGRATGQRFMRIDHIVDERMDPYTASSAAMSLLEYNYSVLGTWPLALTAYNHGAGGISRAVRDTGTRNIETIIANYKGRAFGFASRNFYPQFLAVLQVENNARQYFGDVLLHPAPRFREVVTDSYIDAEAFAGAMGISLAQLREDNRALRPVVWEGNKRIPKGFAIKVREEAVPEGNLLALLSNDFKFSLQTPDIAYVVERGDSLSVIARRFDTSVSRLVSLNQLASSNRIQIGQRILLPQDGAAAVAAAEQQLTLLALEADNEQLASIAASEIPVPPIEVRFEDAVFDELEDTVAEKPLQLALNEELLPPAAVLPDNQQLESDVSQQESEAVALDPSFDVSESNEQLTEALSADPSDYTVAGNNSVEIQASETLGHYADWLGVRAWDVRRLNNMAYRDPVIIGKRLRLDFSRVNIAEFELKRRDFHSSLQNEFFGSYRIQGVEDYTVRRNDNIGAIARNRYSTPIWLLRQYNPGLDFARIQIGQGIVFPLLEEVN